LLIGSAFVPAAAQGIKTSQYFCTVEFSGGIAFDEVRKEWIGTAFRPGAKFIVRLVYEKTRPVKDWPNQRIDEYLVFVTQAGTNKREDCKTPGKDRVEIYDEPQARWMFCSTDKHDYRINFSNNRFIRAFLSSGYFNYVEDTPSVGGGTCTKIE